MSETTYYKRNREVIIMKIEQKIIMKITNNY